MTEEWIDTLTKNGNPTGKSYLKSEVHKKGYYHNTVHIWFYTTNGNVLLAQRAATKLICPNMWDVSVAGHVDSGETIVNAAIRETKEELGLIITKSNLVPIGVFLHENEFKNGAIKDYEFHNVFISKLQCNIVDLKLQKSEVQAVKLVTFKVFEDLLAQSETNLHFVTSNTPYYKFVLQKIKEII